MTKVEESSNQELPTLKPLGRIRNLDYGYVGYLSVKPGFPRDQFDTVDPFQVNCFANRQSQEQHLPLSDEVNSSYFMDCSICSYE